MVEVTRVISKAARALLSELLNKNSEEEGHSLLIDPEVFWGMQKKTVYGEIEGNICVLSSNYEYFK